MDVKTAGKTGRGVLGTNRPGALGEARTKKKAHERWAFFGFLETIFQVNVAARKKKFPQPKFGMHEPVMYRAKAKPAQAAR